MKAKRVGLISDTHGKLRSQVFDTFKDVDVILHAGDIGGSDILMELATIAPVHAVHGNTDDPSIAPESVAVDLNGKIVVIAHGHRMGSPTPANLRAAYPACDMILYGHTHKPLIDDSDTPLVVNPGAAGPARFNLKPSVAILDVKNMAVELIEITG